MGEVINIASRREKNKTNPLKPDEIKQIHLLLCIGEEDLAEILTKFIKTENDFQVTSLTSPYEKDLLKAAEGGSFDMFILLLNNIIYQSEKPDKDIHNENPLELVSYLRKTYRKPVIALYGYPDDPNYANKVRLAGADFVFQLPFKLQPFQDVIEHCLDLI